MRLIGFGHQKRVGKDTAGEFFVREYGFTQMAFATHLKTEAARLFGLTDQQCNGTTEQKEAVIPAWGKSGRRIAQEFGEAMRGIHPDYWVRRVEDKILSGRSYVITDVRYPNEAELIRKLGGIVVKVIRPSLGPSTDTHPSEIALADYDFDDVVVNDGTIPEFYRKLADMFIRYGDL